MRPSKAAANNSRPTAVAAQSSLIENFPWLSGASSTDVGSVLLTGKYLGEWARDSVPA